MVIYYTDGDEVEPLMTPSKETSFRGW